MHRFIYITEDFYAPDGEIIRQYEIGALLNEIGDKCEIQFVNANGPVLVPTHLVKTFDPLKTGDGFENKVCNRCNRFLPVEMFPKNQNGKGDRTIRRPSCNECRVLIDGINVSPKTKKEWDKSKPDMVIWECPICHKRTIPGLTSKVVLDHNHLTGEPRAWICDSCNTGLGRFKDNIEVMNEAIEYLKKE